MVKIRLLMDLAVEPTHGAVAGLVVDAEEVAEVGRDIPRWIFTGNLTGEAIAVMAWEAEEAGNGKVF